MARSILATRLPIKAQNVSWQDEQPYNNNNKIPNDTNPTDENDTSDSDNTENSESQIVNAFTGMANLQKILQYDTDNTQDTDEGTTTL